jgi:hypothetical protein
MDQVEYDREIASVTTLSGSVLIIKGRLHTLNIINDSPQRTNKGIMNISRPFSRLYSRDMLTMGTITLPSIKNGLRGFPLINIPKGKANNKVPINR